MKKVAVYILFICLLFVSCLSTKAVEGPVGTIEYKGEVEIPPTEESAMEAVFDVSETETNVEYSTTFVESADSTNASEAPAFIEMTQEEKKELEETIPDAEEVNYVYKPAEESDVAKIGNVDIPKWFAYLCTGIIIAMLIAMCYISNQNKKKFYFSRRD